NISDGIWYVHVAALNNAGTWGSVSNYQINIDDTTPVAPALTSTTHPNQSAWYSVNTGSGSAATSALSGIAGYAFAIDQNSAGDPGQAITTSGNAFSFTGLADGTWYVHARAISGSGLVSSITTYTLHIDLTPPTGLTVTSLTHEPNVITDHRTVTI